MKDKIEKAIALLKNKRLNTSEQDQIRLLLEDILSSSLKESLIQLQNVHPYPTKLW
jgi:hypothetical protein